MFFHQARLISLSVEEYNQELPRIVLTEGNPPLPVAQSWEGTWEAQLDKSVGLLQCSGVSAGSSGRCTVWKSHAGQCSAGIPKPTPRWRQTMALYHHSCIPRMRNRALLGKRMKNSSERLYMRLKLSSSVVSITKKQPLCWVVPCNWKGLYVTAHWNTQTLFTSAQ